jgi:hypothetical protein
MRNSLIRVVAEKESCTAPENTATWKRARRPGSNELTDWIDAVSRHRYWRDPRALLPGGAILLLRSGQACIDAAKLLSPFTPPKHLC